MKTDLSKILSVSGQHGLYRFVAQSRGGVIAESLSDGKRTSFGMKSRITSLADIAIYTSEGELKLQDVFLKLSASLEGAQAPSSKADENTIKSVFLKAVPDYDDTRFYVSHMKKILDWYKELVTFASLDFEEEKEETAE